MCKHGVIEPFDIYLVDKAITELKYGKAMGVDGLCSEHIKHSHPIVTSVLLRLFNLMLSVRYVPNEFGVGLTIPIPKGSCCSSRSDEYRGVTISPLISKIFETCLLAKMSSYLKPQTDSLDSSRMLAVETLFFMYAAPWTTL